ncbi:hypothetical protein EJB05_36516, partial [Eragrostis curvula]
MSRATRARQGWRGARCWWRRHAGEVGVEVGGSGGTGERGRRRHAGAARDPAPALTSTSSGSKCRRMTWRRRASSGASSHWSLGDGVSVQGRGWSCAHVGSPRSSAITRNTGRQRYSGGKLVSSGNGGARGGARSAAGREARRARARASARCATSAARGGARSTSNSSAERVGREERWEREPVAGEHRGTPSLAPQAPPCATRSLKPGKKCRAAVGAGVCAKEM